MGPTADSRCICPNPQRSDATKGDLSRACPVHGVAAEMDAAMKLMSDDPAEWERRVAGDQPRSAPTGGAQPRRRFAERTRSGDLHGK